MNPSPPSENESPPLPPVTTNEVLVKNHSVSSLTNTKVAAVTNGYSPGDVDEYIIPG